MTIRNTIRLLAGLMLVVALPMAIRGQEEVDPRLQKILADWKKRRAYPGVEYEVRGKSVVLKQSFVQHFEVKKKPPPFEPKDISLEWNIRLLLDVKTQRHMYEQEKDIANVSSGTVRRMKSVKGFDGKMMTGRGRDIIDGKEVKRGPDTPDVAVITGNLANAFFESQVLPLFSGHGVVLFPPQQHLIPGVLDFEPNSALMSVHGTDVYDGRSCVVLRSYPTGYKNFQEFWVDPSRESALVRWIAYGGGFPGLQFRVRYQKHGPLWLVSSWTFEIPSHQVFRFTVVKTTIHGDLPDTRFRLPIEPGMLVIRQHNPLDKNPLMVKEAGKSEHFRVESSGREAPVVFENGVERPRWNVTTWLVAGAFLCATLGAWWMWRRRNGKRLENSKRVSSE